MEKLSGRFIVLVLAISLTAGIANAVDLTSGLIGYWPLDGDATDSVGDADGDLAGGAEWVGDGWRNGAVKLDGSTGYVDIPGWQFEAGDNATFAAWINGWRQTGWAGIVCCRGDITFWLGFTDQDTLGYVWNNDAEATWGWREGPRIPQNEWAMVAIAIEPDQATSYVYTDEGGLELGVNDIAHIEQMFSGNLNFGWDSCEGAGARHFEGIIDEVMIYDRALSEDKIRQLATSGLSVVAPAAKLTTTWGRIKVRY